MGEYDLFMNVKAEQLGSIDSALELAKDDYRTPYCHITQYCFTNPFLRENVTYEQMLTAVGVDIGGLEGTIDVNDHVKGLVVRILVDENALTEPAAAAHLKRYSLGLKARIGHYLRSVDGYSGIESQGVQQPISLKMN